MQKGSVLGYDLNEKNCQISYYDENKEEPETMEAAVDNYQIPLILGYYKERWVYGQEAKRLREAGDQSLLHQLHREPYRTRNWKYFPGQADHHSDPAVLQQSAEKRTSSAQKLPATERCQPQFQSGAGCSHTAAQLPGAGGGGATHSHQPRPGLQAAAA